MPEVSTYTLSSRPRHVIKALRTRKTLLVSQPTASPGYQSARMIYVNKPYQLKSFGRNAWVAAPADMLAPLLVQTLRDTHHFNAVVSPPFTGITDLRMDVHLLTMQQEFISETRSQMHIALQVNLLNNVSNKIIGSHRYEIAMPARNGDPYGGVIAANKATAKLLAKIAEFVVKNTRRV